MSKLREMHGLHGTPEYSVWKAMNKRCRNKNSFDYRYYGAKGISVFPAWQTSFVAFLEHVGPRPQGTWIDRLDNTKGYEPGNVAWKTPTEQQRNKGNNHLYFIRGENLTLRKIHELYGDCSVNLYTFMGRVKRSGWEIEKALKHPIREKASCQK